MIVITSLETGNSTAYEGSLEELKIAIVKYASDIEGREYALEDWDEAVDNIGLQICEVNKSNTYKEPDEALWNL